MVSILVVDDHTSVREGTKAILQSVEDFEIHFYQPPYTKESVKEMDFSLYDVVLMDLNLGNDNINGIQLSKEILKHHKKIKIILYTGYSVDDYLDEAIRIGIYGAINKSDDKEKTIDYIKHVLDGDIVVNFKYFQMNKVRADEHNAEEEPKENLINEREKAILIEVEKGLTNQEIADKLHLSKRSIEYSLTNIYSKLNIGTRTEAVLIAKSEGIIE